MAGCPHGGGGHISPNATGLQLQINGRAGRGSEFVSEKRLFFEFGLLADFQNFVMKNVVV